MGYKLRDSVEAYQVGMYSLMPQWVEDDENISLERDETTVDGKLKKVLNAYFIQNNRVTYVPEGDYILKLEGQLYTLPEKVFESMIAKP